MTQEQNCATETLYPWNRGAARWLLLRLFSRSRVRQEDFKYNQRRADTDSCFGAALIVLEGFLPNAAAKKQA